MYRLSIGLCAGACGTLSVLDAFGSNYWHGLGYFVTAALLSEAFRAWIVE